MNITQIEAGFYKRKNGEDRYAVTAHVDGKREIFKVYGTLGEAIELHTRVNAYVEGKYDEEVFSILNDIAQERAERNAPQRWEG